MGPGPGRALPAPSQLAAPRPARDTAFVGVDKVSVGVFAPLTYALGEEPRHVRRGVLELGIGRVDLASGERFRSHAVLPTIDFIWAW